ncbi:MAG: hypothetical protein AB8G99_20660 [Planctomycetaceae bacterium]
MSAPTKTRFVYTVIVCLGVAALSLGLSAPMRAQEVSLKKQLRGRQRLLRKVYVNAPDHDVKGLAASIKADEITVKHRIRAIRYLATVDSVAYPEAKQMLIDRLHNDQWEEVRFEAAKALRLMMAGNSGGFVRNRRLFRMWLRRWRRHTRRSFRTRVRGRYDFQSNPCDPATLNALVRTAYELDENQYCFEPSRRTRNMAVLAIRASGVVCDVGPYISTSSDMRFSSNVDVPSTGTPSQIPSLVEAASEPKEQPVARDPRPPQPKASPILASDFETRSKAKRVRRVGAQVEENSMTSEEEVIDWSLFENTASANPQADETSVAEAEPLLSEELLFEPEEAAPVPTPLTEPAPCLNGYCVVGLWYEQTLPADPQFNTVYQERVYHFSSASAKQQFDADPERFAVAYGGFDPVAYGSSQTLIDGVMLRAFKGYFYAFASQENWEEFLTEPELYALRQDDLLSDDAYREKAIEEFEAMEAELAPINSADNGFEVEDSYEPEILKFDLDSVEPTFDVPADTKAEDNSASNTTTQSDQQTELSYGVLEYNKAEIADFGNIQLIAPPPVGGSAPAAQSSGGAKQQPRRAAELPEVESPFEFTEEELFELPQGEPANVLSEIEEILGVRQKPDRDKPAKTNRSTQRDQSRSNRVQSADAERWIAPWHDRTLITRVSANRTPTIKERAERILPLTTPSRNRGKVSGAWSSFITGSNQSKAPVVKPLVSSRSKLTRSPASAGDMRVDSITRRAQTRTVARREIEVVNLAKRRRNSNTLQRRPATRSANSVVPKSGSKPSRQSTLIRPTRPKVERLVPRSSSTTSLQKRSDPSKVTTITGHKGR